jgi:hypothetical protein
MPHDADHRRLGVNAKSAKQHAEDAGIKPVTVLPRIAHRTGRHSGIALVPAEVWIDESRCARLILCLDSYRKEWDDKNAVWKDKPVHDEYSTGTSRSRLLRSGSPRFRRTTTRFDAASQGQMEIRAHAILCRRFISIPGAMWEGPWGDQFENSIKVEIDKLTKGVDKIVTDYRANRIVPDFRPSGGSSDPGHRQHARRHPPRRQLLLQGPAGARQRVRGGSGGRHGRLSPGQRAGRPVRQATATSSASTRA